MLFNELVDHCSPTLAGIKTGNLFPLHEDCNSVLDEVRKLNSIFVKKGLRMIPIKRKSGCTLIYLYRPERLRKDLSAPEAQNILKEKGYPCGCPGRCVSCLIHHLVLDDDFPHEVGLFLGYPPYDVKCFMKDSRKGVSCVGCWKVYGDAREAQKTFERFRKCTAVYQKLRSRGRSLEQLIV